MVAWITSGGFVYFLLLATLGGLPGPGRPSPSAGMMWSVSST